MDGIVFFATKDLKGIVDFYTNRIGGEVWLDQGDCTILSFGSMKLGFCQRDHLENSGIICLVYEDIAEVDNIFKLLEDVSNEQPKHNPKYNIYHFFAADPEGRTLEFQSFE